MKKLTRKLLLSIFAIVFALVTLGSTTFAWFTLSTTTEVVEFDSTINSGTGIEISIDGLNFSRKVFLDQLEEEVLDILLDPITTENGRQFFKLVTDDPFLYDSEAGETGEIKYNLDTATANESYIEFTLYFRSPEKDVKVYLTNKSEVTSLETPWISDTTFMYGSDGDDEVEEGDSINIYAANAIRMSFDEYSVKAEVEDAPKVIKDEIKGDPLVFANFNNSGYDDIPLEDDVLETGNVSYFRAKTEYDLLNPEIDEDEGQDEYEFVTAKLPSTIHQFANMSSLGGASPIVTLASTADEGSDYDWYYGAIVVRIWLEGWDPDCFNSVMANVVTFKLHFQTEDLE